MKPWRRRLLWTIGITAVVYGMVYGDVVMRAHEAYQEGEKYWRWAEHPEEHQKILDEKLAKEKSDLSALKAAEKIDADEYERRLDLAQFDHDQASKESNIKYAYIWYQTAVDLFSPPNSKWVRLSREKMPLAKERWKAELRAQGVPFEDYMID